MSFDSIFLALDSFASIVYFLSDHYLFYPFLLITALNILISIKMSFIQFTSIPKILSMLLFNDSSTEISGDTISPRSALLVSMSTAVGMGCIAGPIITLGFGGPAALGAFVLAIIFGASTTFVEVFLALKYRVVDDFGNISGGPMQYLQSEFGRPLAAFYAFSTFFLLLFWTANQANSLTVLLSSSTGISSYLSAIFILVFVLIVLSGGIKRLGQINSALVPVMFVLYCSACCAILFKCYENILPSLAMIFDFKSVAASLVGASSGVSFLAMSRWGLARAMQASEVGVGTSTFGHSSSSAKNPHSQAILGMATAYATAFLALLTGLTVMSTNILSSDSVSPDISAFYKIMETFFPLFGPILLVVCCLLFGLGTILGNCYNAEKCFEFLSNRKKLFYAACIASILWGSVSSVKLVWTVVDFLIIPVALTHMIAIFIIAFRNNFFKKSKGS